MGDAGKPAQTRLFCGMLAADNALFTRAEALLEEAFGAIDSASSIIPFTFTDYYAAEMGTGLLRKFVSFAPPVDPGRLADIKLLTIELERKLAEAGEPMRRRVNLDPGYVTPAKVVLATTKNFAHRICLGQGIYAEITLNFDRKGCIFHDWTYPDFRSEFYARYLLELRELCMAQAREGGQSE